MSDEWADLYGQLADHVVSHARGAELVLTGFGACVDHVHRLGGTDLDRLADTAREDGDPDLVHLLREVVARIAGGGDGEIFHPVPRQRLESGGLLGEPHARQLGGTGAQVSWTLAALGAGSVMALVDRSHEQLQSVPPTVGLCSGERVQPARDITPVSRTGKAPHYILEFSRGTEWSRGTVPRSSRLIVRVEDDGIERDQAFADAAPRLIASAGAGLVSGMNGIPDGDSDSWQWLDTLVMSWREGGLRWIHLELAEYAQPNALPMLAARYGGIANSLGLNLSELAAFGPVDADPAGVALNVAQRFGFTRVLVHADTWSMAVHRSDRREAARAVATGNLLAGARAACGGPTHRLEPQRAATYTSDHPQSGPVGRGWAVECVPAPFLPAPATTIGLGDSFVAGALLSGCLPAD